MRIMSRIDVGGPINFRIFRAGHCYKRLREKQGDP